MVFGSTITFIVLSVVLTVLLWRFVRLDQALTRWFEDRIFRRNQSKETKVDITTAAKLNIGNLPANMDFIAGFGKEKAAPQDMTDTILRPTVGLRFISVVLAGACLWLTWFGPKDLIGESLQLRLGLTAVLAYAAAYIQLYQLRYDHARFVHLNWFFRQQAHDWQDLTSIKDNGHYLYELRMEKGRKVEVQKYLVGIPGFVAFAKNQVVQNTLRDARA